MAQPTQLTAKLGDIVQTSEQRTYVKTEPVYIRKLVGAVGNQARAAVLLGLTGSSIGNILSANTTTLSNELAARYIWGRDFAPKPEVQDIAVAVITGQPHHIKTVQDWVVALGGTFQLIETNKKG